MNIVFFTHRFLPDIGGIELSVHHLASALSELGHDVTIVTESRDRNGYQGVSAYRTVRFHVQQRRPLTRFRCWMWMWRHRAEFDNADVLHFHDFTTFINWFLPLRFVLHKPTYAITYHGFEGWPIRTVHKMLRRITSWLMHVRLGVGDYISTYYGHKIDMYYLGAAVHFRTSEQIPVRHRFIYIGRLEQDTEILPFVRCLRAVADRVEEPLELRLVGDGNLLTALLALSSEKLEITHIPATNSVEEELQKAEFIVCTGFLALFDAFSFKRPALIPAFSEIKKQYFTSIPAIERMAFIGHDEEEMVQLLNRLLQQNGINCYESMVDKAEEFVSKLSWKSIALKHLALYDRA